MIIIKDKYKQIKRVLLVILIANIIIALIKLVLGYLYKVNSITADGFHALADSSSNIIGLVGISFASKPADKHHHYGHSKFETIASFIIGMMLFLITIQIIINAISCFINPVEPTINELSIILMLVTLIINIFVTVIEYKKGKELSSEVLISDSIHTRTDVIISLGVIVSLVLIKFGLPIIIDPIISIVIGIYILKSSMQIFKESIGILVDKNIIDEKEIKTILLEELEVYNSEFEEENSVIVYDLHKIRNTGRNDHIYLDFHIVINPSTKIRSIHEMTHYLENRLNLRLGKLVEIYTHIEPLE